MEFYGAVESTLDPTVGIGATFENRVKIGAGAWGGDRADIAPKFRAILQRD